MQTARKPGSIYSSERRANLILGIAMLIIGLVMIVPLVWMISTSFKPLRQVYEPNWIPNPITLANYEKVFGRIPVFRFLGNSLLVSAAVTVFQLLIGTLAAYAFARIRFQGRNVIFIIFLGTMMIPAYIIIIPLYLIVDRMGLVNTYLAMILPKMVSVFAIYMLRAFFSSMPKELDESAFIDGASRVRVLFSIYVPLAKSAYAALLIFLFMNAWNDFMWPLIVTSEEKMRTMQVGIAYFKDSNITDYGATMAASFLCSIPILAVFLFANKQIVQGITMTGIKA